MNPRFITILVGYALLQNIVLTTGFGVSILVRSARKRSTMLKQGVLLSLFMLLTTAVCYPLDQLVGRDVLDIRWFRPLVIVVVTAVLFMAIRILLARLWPSMAEKVGGQLHLAAFNNLVIGTAVMIYLGNTWSFLQVLAAAAGASLGYLLLSWLTAEGMERLDNPDVPRAFRGLPSVLIYLGLLALATMGF